MKKMFFWSILTILLISSCNKETVSEIELLNEIESKSFDKGSEELIFCVDHNVEWYYSDLLDYYIWLDIDGGSTGIPPGAPGSVGFMGAYPEIAAFGFSPVQPINYSQAELLIGIPEARRPYVSHVRVLYKYQNDSNGFVSSGDYYAFEDTSNGQLIDGYIFPANFGKGLFATPGCLQLSVVIYYTDVKAMSISTKTFKVDVASSYHYKLIEDLDI